MTRLMRDASRSLGPARGHAPALVIALWGLAGAACSRDAPVETVRWMALGTLFEVSVAAPPPGHSTEDLQRVLEAVVAPWDADMYPYRAGELARANARFGVGACVMPSARLRTLINSARHLEAIHDGLFVPALGSVTRLWRLHETSLMDWQAPAIEQVSAAMTPPPRASYLVDRAEKICAVGPVALDFGGFAKGHIVDELLDQLGQRGLRDVIVNAGGDLAVRGSRAGQPWRIAIRDPFAHGALAGLEARDGEAVFTSGNYERHVMLDGVRYGHILDPTTGHPLRGIASVTVLGDDAARTDAAATALYVAAARERASAGDLSALAPVTDASAFLILDEDGTAWVSSSLQPRLTWVARPAAVHVIDAGRTAGSR